MSPIALEARLAELSRPLADLNALHDSGAGVLPPEARASLARIGVELTTDAGPLDAIGAIWQQACEWVARDRLQP